MAIEGPEEIKKSSTVKRRKGKKGEKNRSRKRGPAK